MSHRFVPFIALLLTAAPVLAHDDEADHDHHDRAAIHAPHVGDAVPWTSLDANNDPDHFQFVIVTDRTGGHRDGVFEQGVAKTNLLQPEFVVCVGDLIEGYTDVESRVDAEWDEFEGMVARLQMPFFYLPGNHDITNPMMARKWAERFGPSFYHFVYRDVLFVCLNTEDREPSNISDAQVAYVEQTLASYPDVRWTIVLMHKPLWVYAEGDKGHKQFARIEDALRGRDYTVFAGHYHSYAKYDRHDQRYIILATTGGATQLRGTPYGEFDHVVWVTITDDGPLLANLMLDGIHDENVTTEQSLQLVRDLEAGMKLRLHALYSESDVFPGGGTVLELTNDTKLPVSIRGYFGHSNSLQPMPYVVAMDIPAGESRQVPVKISVDEPSPAEDLAPLPFEWTAVFTPEQGNPITLKGNDLFNATRMQTIARAASTVTVDGSLDDWSDLSLNLDHSAHVNRAQTWTGPDDMHARFALTYDDDNVYVAVDVTDETLQSRPDRNPWGQDGIEVRLDPRDDPQRASGRGDNDRSGRDFLFFAVSPADDPAQRSVWPKSGMPNGVQLVCVPTATGYAAEIAIPHAVLNDLRDHGDWTHLRFNLTVNDLDEDAGLATQIWWQGDWRTDHNVTGSGTFRRD